MPTPDYPVYQRDENFNLFGGDGATPTEVFSLICIATTLSLDEAIDTDDSLVIDCANPQNLAVRQSVAKSQTWDIAFSGKCDFARFTTLRTRFDGTERNYQVQKFGTGAKGGGIYQGAAILTSLKLDKNDNGMVSFSGALKGQRLLTYTANA